MYTGRLIRNIRMGIKTLLLHKLRSALTMLGVVFGVGSVIAMLSVGEGASQQALEQIRKLGSTNILIHSTRPTDEQTDGQRRRISIFGLHYDDDLRIRESFPDVLRTVPVKQIPMEGRLGSRSLDLRIVATTSDWFDLVPRRIIAGRTLNASDDDQRRNVVVLTEHGARRLLATASTVGETIRLGGNAFRVVGIIRNEEAVGGAQIPDSRIDAYIPLEVGKERFGDIILRRSAGQTERELVELHSIIVEVRSVDAVERTAEAIERMLSTWHPRGDYEMNVPLALLRQAEEQQRIWNWTLGSVAGISLLVGGIGIMNIMLASVTERTREIGIRRAIGARKRQIVAQFLIETVVLAALGGLIGILLGPLLAVVIREFSGIPTIVPAYAVILSVGISMVVGIVFGLYPAARAANLDPIQALRHE
ncbi:MAG: ABC transporter permease [Phycisphaeraceae bacterium]|nr:ABC transporter permease [Phycisphaeraceae bacterium]